MVGDYLFRVLRGLGIILSMGQVIFNHVSIGADFIASPLFLAAIVCGLIGDLTMRYCIMKGALYSPLI